MKVILKELRETIISLKIIHRTKLYKSEQKVLLALKENDELIAIFVRSVETAQKNMGAELTSARTSKIVSR